MVFVGVHKFSLHMILILFNFSFVFALIWWFLSLVLTKFGEKHISLDLYTCTL